MKTFFCPVYHWNRTYSGLTQEIRLLIWKTINKKKGKEKVKLKIICTDKNLLNLKQEVFGFFVVVMLREGGIVWTEAEKL